MNAMFVHRLLLIILIVSLIFIIGCQQTPIFSDNTEQIDIMINENRSEIDYKDYVTIKMKPSEILFNKTTVEQIIDNELCNIVYYVIIENITDENININLKILIPDELTSTMIYGEPSLGPRPKYIELKPGEKIDIAHGTLLNM